ncbi:MAG: PIN domain-containing protein [Capsulimonadaceae bacterium]
MEIHLVADTNLFFECRSLDQLPWHQLGYDPVVVLLTKPVLDEIDKHKKATGRTRTRALTIFGHVRGMLTSSVQELEIQPSSPNVVLRLTSNVKPDPALKEYLDYTKTDERLVGIVSTLIAQTSRHCVKLFTDDTGPAMTADSLGVPYLMIDEGWRRMPSETTEDKRIKELERDLATYRAQEPKISISACKTADKPNLVEVIRKVAAPLTKAEIEELLAALRLKHPLVVDFTPPPSSSKTDPTGEVTRVEYASPTGDEIANYHDVLYPQWINECRQVFNSIHDDRDEIEPPVVLRWAMSNEGTRPASQVRIEFEAHGPLALRRLQMHAEDDEDAPVDNRSSQAVAATVPRLPSAPRPPSFQKRVTVVPSPGTSKPRQGINASKLRGGGLSDERYRGIAEISKVLGRGHFDPFADTGIAAVLRQSRMFDNLARINTMQDRIIAPLAVSRPSPKLRDPESFYYDWPTAKQVKKGSLTCELWRHQAGEEVFEFEVLFTTEGEARGMVQCSVHAENLTKPEQARVMVCRTIVRLSMMGLANAIVGDCK